MSTVPVSSSTKWLITVTVMLVAVMEVLDITIVNVAMPDMMGTFGATTTQITWVVTAYVIASAILMPLTGFLVDNFGRRRILLINIGGFLITSILCGTSTTLIEIIAFRALQGVFGAALIPLPQYILRDTFPPQEIGKAMAIWAMGIMVGPILGPTLGGYITEHLNWHWVFFINIPVCVIAFVLTLSLITESELQPKPIDWLGILLLALGVGCFQTFIEEGSRYQWFQSNGILILFIVAMFCIVGFVIHSYKNPNSVIDINLFRNRQFVSCTLILTFFAMALFGALVMQPLMTQVLMNYPPSKSGLIMAPRGLASLLMMPFVPILMKRINAKYLILAGISMTAYGTFLMAGWNLQTAMGTMASDSIVQGIGMSFVFGPLSTIVFETLPKTQIAVASGMFSFGRNIGLSVGVALLSTVLNDQSQVHWNQLGEHINVYNANLTHWLNVQHISLTDPTTPVHLANLLNLHATMLSYLDVYRVAAFAFVFMLPLVFFIKRGFTSGSTMGAH